MESRRVEGVVLKAIPHKEGDRIITLLTKEEGRLSLYVQGVSKRGGNRLSLTTPLASGEFIYRKRGSELHAFLDGTVSDLHLPLRRSYPHLKCGMKMVEFLLKTQLPERREERLYLLLRSFLRHLPTLRSPAVGWAAFQLKVLKVEGAFTEKALPHGEEGALARLLANARSFTLLKELEIPPSLLESVEALSHSTYLRYT